MNTANLDTRLTTLLKESLHQKTGQVLLLNIPLEKTTAVNLAVIKALQPLNLKGIYISLVTDCQKLAQIFKTHDFNLSSFTVIDGVSQLYGTPKITDDHLIYVPGPLSLDQIATELETLLQKESGTQHFIILDCLTSLLLYNSLAKTVEFLKRINEIIQKNKSLGIFLVYNKSSALQTLSDELNHHTKIIDLSD